jgi:hypothetical protein
MKKLILSVSAIVGFSMVGFSQGVQFADASAPSFDTTIAGAPNTTQDLNLVLLEGSTAATATTPIATLLLSDGTASGDISVFGFIYDNSGTVYPTPAASVYFQIEAWTGTQYNSYAAALASGVTGEFAGTSAVFNETIPGPPNTPPALTGVGIVALTQVPTTIVPEPSTLAMAGVGLASMLIFRRKNS